MTKARLEEAARLIHEARSIIDDYAGRELDAAARMQVDQLLSKAQDARRAVRRGDLRDRDGDVSSSPASRAFFKWLRGQSGRGHRRDFLSPEEKKLVEDATGQILVPEDVTEAMSKELANEGLVRPLARVRPTQSDRVKVRPLGPVTTGWAKLETEPSPGGTQLSEVESTPTPEAQTIVVHNLIALAQVGEDELDDSDTNLEQVLLDVFGAEMAEQEDVAFADGDGVSKPLGILRDANVTVVNSEAIGAVSTDDLLGLMFTLGSRLRRRGVFMADSSVEKAAMQLKDSAGRYIWEPAMVPGVRDGLLFGKPFVANDDLPNLNTGATRVKTTLFGDFERGFMIVDRQRITLKRLEELYAEEGLVGLRLTHRVGGAVVRPLAFAILNQ